MNMPSTGSQLSPTGARITPAVFAVTATGTAHRAGSQDGARANAIDVLQRHATSARMAARIEQHATAVWKLREQSVQARSEFQPGTMREARAEQEAK